MKSYNRNIVIWLFTGCLLVFCMVIIGGITRLTGSGLSITEWKLIRGILPPLNEQQWTEEFNNYRQIPQYRELNYNYTLKDFKAIYWWEYIHRLIGRIIGLVFLVPFLFFLITKQIKVEIDKVLVIFLFGILQFYFTNQIINTQPLIKAVSTLVFCVISIYYFYYAIRSNGIFHKLIFLFFLGALQGFLGWYMVKSGLINNVRVSHLRLAIHLLTAFITFGFIFWVMLGIIYPEKDKVNVLTKSLQKLSLVILLLTILQIIYGAFVAGLKAGHIYNTFPKMGDEWIPEAVTYGWQVEGVDSLISNITSVQLIHRSIAWLLTFLIIAIWVYAKKKNTPIAIGAEKILLSTRQNQALNILLIAIIFQFWLGVFTLLYNVPITLGVIHQAGAFMLFSSALYLTHTLRLKEN